MIEYKMYYVFGGKSMDNIDNSAEVAKMLGKEGNLSNEQIEDFESGKAIELPSGGLSEDAMKSINAMNDINFDEILGANNGGEAEPQPPEPAPSASTAPAEAYYSSSDDHDDHDGIIIQRGVSEVHGFKLPRFIRKFIAFMIILAIGFGIGYGAHYFRSLGVFTSYTNDISLKSVRAVQARAIPDGQRFKAIEIYVKQDAEFTECIIFGVTFSEANSYTPTYFRLIINNEDHSDSKIFTPFNPERHERLLNSDDMRDRLTAAHMVENYEIFLRSLNEINAGNPRWERADVEYVNKQLMLEG